MRAQSDSAAPPVVPSLYVTRITHVRTTPLRHTIRTASYWWFVDVDDLPRLPFYLRPFAGFRSSDHFGASDDSFRSKVDAFLTARGVTAGGQVLMLANARVLGRVFNPLSVFWCYRPDGTLACVVAEVHNTYKERHAYLMETDERGRAETPKEFYVSPFNDVSGTYTMSLPVPGEKLDLVVTLHREGQAPFVASVKGERSDVGAFAGIALRHPLETLRVDARIKQHGIWLFLRRLPVQKRPHHPDPFHSSQEGVS